MPLITLDDIVKDLLHKSYPATNSAGDDAHKLSAAAFPSLSVNLPPFKPRAPIPMAPPLTRTPQYTPDQQSEIDRWLLTSLNLSSPIEDPSQSTTSLADLNAHLSTRTTLLGSVPSVADAVLYARLAPVVKSWTAEQRTGAEGWHHIVRYVDFVQNGTLCGVKVEEGEKVHINPDEVLAKVKTFDAKAEKEKKKREKIAAAAAEGERVGGNEAGVNAGNEKGRAVGEDAKGAETEKGVTEQVKEKAAQVTSAVAAAMPGAKTEKKEKKPKAPKAPAAPTVEKPLSPSLIDLRVGHILKATTHPNADSLYVSTIACGDPPGTDNTSEFEGQVVRTVCSGLNGLIPLAEMQNRKIIAVCNLKPVTMRGVKSAAMVLAASPRLAPGEVDNHAGPVELVNPPESAVAGERVWFEGFEGEPEGVLNPKKKVWEMCQAGFSTSGEREVVFQPEEVEMLKGSGKGMGRLVVNGGGVCTVQSLTGATVR